MVRALPAIELCAGMGGMGLGIRNLGYEIVQAYEVWADAVAIYNHNFPGHVAQTCNLLSGAALRQIAADKRRFGDVELLAAGPPCKGFSRLQNGRHDGRNGHNRVLAAMPEYIGIIRPRMFLLENVPDLLRHREGRTFSTLLERLQRPARGLRYNVEHRIYDAAHFGTPQARRRVFIFGTRGPGADLAHLPEPGPDLSPLYSALRHGGAVPAHLRSFLNALKDPDDRSLTSARQALSDLPVLEAGAIDQEIEYLTAPATAFQRWVRRHASTKLKDVQAPRITPAALARLSHIDPGGCARSIPRQHLNGLSRRYDSAYRRLHPDAPSTALSTKYDCVYHYAVPRSLSVREYARLQAIPDHVEFPASLTSRRNAYEMIGNSVPPLLIEGILAGVVEQIHRGRA